MTPVPLPTDTPAPTSTLSPGDIDGDGDGYTPNQGDCNDADPDIHPNAPDPSDGIDQDCDGDPFG
jgi:hypothetical protein